jgi:membrane-bound metal-dependent hydrolase YbcI (DUF457 family)
VDPVSHLLLARLVAAARPTRHLPRGVIAATVLGGIAPDIDAGLMAVGWDVYLRWHDAGTHALVGTLPVAVLTAGFVRTWARQAPLGALIVGAWLGVLSHVGFDLYSGATIRVLWPLTDSAWAVPIVAMADPLAIAAMLAGAIALWVWPRVPRTAAALALTLLVLISAVKVTTRTMATRTYRAAVAADAPPTQVAVEAMWGSWREWLFFDRLADGRVRAWRVDGLANSADIRFEQPDTRDEVFAHASLADFSTARNFVPAHPFAFAVARAADPERQAVVFWSDTRFCWAAGEQGDSQEGAPHQDVRPPVGPVRCALWFGGSYDAEGRPHQSLVWLGGHVQRRSPLRW